MSRIVLSTLTVGNYFAYLIEKQIYCDHIISGRARVCAFEIRHLIITNYISNDFLWHFQQMKSVNDFLYLVLMKSITLIKTVHIVGT